MNYLEMRMLFRELDEISSAMMLTWVILTYYTSVCSLTRQKTPFNSYSHTFPGLERKKKDKENIFKKPRNIKMVVITVISSLTYKRGSWLVFSPCLHAYLNITICDCRLINSYYSIQGLLPRNRVQGNQDGNRTIISPAASSSILFSIKIQLAFIFSLTLETIAGVTALSEGFRDCLGRHKTVYKWQWLIFTDKKIFK